MHSTNNSSNDSPPLSTIQSTNHSSTIQSTNHSSTVQSTNHCVADNSANHSSANNSYSECTPDSGPFIFVFAGPNLRRRWRDSTYSADCGFGCHLFGPAEAAAAEGQARGCSQQAAEGSGRGFHR